MDATRFSLVARAIGPAAKSLGLEQAVAYRTPPRKAGENRTLRRLEGAAVVSVAMRGRPDQDVIVDMVTGTMAANHQSPQHSAYELLLEAAYDTVAGDTRADQPLVSREALGLKPRPPKPVPDAADPPCNHDPALEPF